MYFYQSLFFTSNNSCTNNKYNPSSEGLSNWHTSIMPKVATGKWILNIWAKPELKEWKVKKESSLSEIVKVKIFWLHIKNQKKNCVWKK